MTEWGVVLVMVALAGLVTTIVKPILKMTNAIAKLTGLVETCEKDLSCMNLRNAESHKRLFDKQDRQGAQISDHETRISVIEHSEHGSDGR